MGLFRRKERVYYVVETIPAKSEVCDGLLYNTREAVLLAYSLVNENKNCGAYEPHYYWGVDYEGLYRTKNKRYFIHRFDNHLSVSDYLYPLDENEARKKYHESKVKLIQWVLPMA